MKKQKPIKRRKFSFLFGKYSKQVGAFLNFQFNRTRGFLPNIRIVLTSKQLQVYPYIISIISTYFKSKEITLSFFPFFQKGLEILRKDVKTRGVRWFSDSWKKKNWWKSSKHFAECYGSFPASMDFFFAQSWYVELNYAIKFLKDKIVSDHKQKRI